VTEKPAGIEHYEKRFGIIAIEKGFISPDELIEALTVQVQESANQIEEVVKVILQDPSG
jgi:hypothetical protein